MTKRRPVRVRGPHALRRRATGPADSASDAWTTGSVIEAAVSRALERSEAALCTPTRTRRWPGDSTIALLLDGRRRRLDATVPSAFAVSAIAPDLTPGGNGAAIDLANPRDPWAFIVETAPTIVLLGAAVDIRTALPPGNCASVAATLGGEYTRRASKSTAWSSAMRRSRCTAPAPRSGSSSQPTKTGLRCSDSASRACPASAGRPGQLLSASYRSRPQSRRAATHPMGS